MNCQPLGTIAVPTPGTPVAITGGPAAAYQIAIQAVPTMTGSLIVKVSDTAVAILAAGQTWNTPGAGGNLIPSAQFSLDATAGATGAAGIVSAWIR